MPRLKLRQPSPLNNYNNPDRHHQIIPYKQSRNIHASISQYLRYPPQPRRRHHGGRQSVLGQQCRSHL